MFKELPEKDGDWVFVLYQWATNWDILKEDNNKTVNNYVLSLIKDKAKKFVKFLMHQREIAHLDNRTFNLNKFSKIYNLAEFQKLAGKFKNDPSLSNKEKKIIEIFLKLNQDRKANK